MLGRCEPSVATRCSVCHLPPRPRPQRSHDTAKTHTARRYNAPRHQAAAPVATSVERYRGTPLHLRRLHRGWGVRWVAQQLHPSRRRCWASRTGVERDAATVAAPVSSAHHPPHGLVAPLGAASCSNWVASTHMCPAPHTGRTATHRRQPPPAQPSTLPLAAPSLPPCRRTGRPLQAVPRVSTTRRSQRQPGTTRRGYEVSPTAAMLPRTRCDIRGFC